MEKEKPLIILVDDNPVNLRMGKNLLDKKYTVITAPTAQKMFHLLDEPKNTPALILLDIDMPGIDGFGAMEMLKSEPRTAAIPVIFLTAFSETNHVHKGFSLGATDYIRKPYEPELLFERIEKVLKETAPQQENTQQAE